MIKRKYKLSNRNAIRRSSRYGKQARYSEMSVRYIGNNVGHPRMVVVVSKKVSKVAVRRNLIRRQVTEAYRQDILSSLKSPLDIVIFVHNDNILKKTPQELTSDLMNLINKIVI